MLSEVVASFDDVPVEFQLLVNIDITELMCSWQIQDQSESKEYTSLFYKWHTAGISCPNLIANLLLLMISASVQIAHCNQSSAMHRQ